MVFFLSILVVLSCFSLAKTDCEKGEYETEGVAFGWFSKCKDCQPGSYNNVPGEQCKVCERGTVSAGEGAEYCLSCPRGHYSDVEGSTVCTPCAEGTFTANKGAAECEPCPAGYSNHQQGQAECVECSAGHYSVGGAAQCTPCDTGDTAPAGSTSASACTSHCSGGYQHLVTQDGHTSCQECPAGTYSESGNCTLCSAGYTSVNGSDKCTECRAGTYNSKYGAIRCYECLAGQYANSTLCEFCPEGTTSDSGAGSVEDCFIPEVEIVKGTEDTVLSAAKSSVTGSSAQMYYAVAGVFALVLTVFLVLLIWKCRSKNADKLGSMRFSSAETYVNDYGTCNEERNDTLEKFCDEK